MPMHDLLHAELAAALDDLLQRRDHRLAAIEAEALGAGDISCRRNFSKPLGLDQLVEDRLLAGSVKPISLSGPSMRS